MASYIIKGGKKLTGTVNISGSKNASLPILAASILNTKTILYNVPKISDTQKTLEILKILGSQIEYKKNKIIINSSNIINNEIPNKQMRELRSSVILAGALMARKKEAIFSYPGGCDIGSRPIDLHLNAFKKLGINIEEYYGKIRCFCDKIIGTEINLDFPSVGATENIMLASVMAEGETKIINAALEPEIIDLQNMLNRMGAKISGAGTNIIQIKGVKQLKECSYNIMADRIEAGTYLVAAAMTGGRINVCGINPEYISPILSKLEEMGCKIEKNKDTIKLEAPRKLKSNEIKTLPYPGFPTDMQSIMGVAFTISKGTSIIIENIFENRFKYLNELERMGAKVVINGQMAVIKGIKNLHATDINATDLRGGAALILAGLVANGITRINNIEYVLRGYDNIVEKLKSLGAQIEK